MVDKDDFPLFCESPWWACRRDVGMGEDEEWREKPEELGFMGLLGSQLCPHDVAMVRQQDVM